MTTYEKARLLNSLNSLLIEWAGAHKQPDLADRQEWVRGVVKGIQLCIYATSNLFKEAA